MHYQREKEFTTDVKNTPTATREMGNADCAHHFDEPRPQGGAGLNLTILLIFLLSGIAGLAYELVWVKTLSLIFGVSSQAITTVLAAFMGGLALGSLIFGRRADRSRSPLRLYAALEVGIGVSALLLPYIFPLINRLYVLMAQTFPDHSWVFTTTRFLLCFAALLVPTTLMGGTLPAISRFLVVRFDRVGRGVGLLYGANTVGGILGCLATGFLLLRFLGAHGTTLVAVTLNLIAGLVAFHIAAHYGRIRPVSATTTRQTPQQQNAASESAPPRPGAAEAGHRTLGTFVLVSFGVAGATSLAYEVLWTRVLVYFVGISIYSFTMILATFLTGLALGSFCFARVADRRKDLLIVFGVLELAIGLCAVYLLQTTGMALSFQTASFSWLTSLAGDLAKASSLMLVPTFLMGAVFPVVTKLYTPSVSRLGGSLGNLYAANTIGAVAGSLLAGFVLLPALGAQKSIILVAGINLVLGTLALLLSPTRTRLRPLVLGVAIPALLVGGFLTTRIKPTVTYCYASQNEGLNELLYYHEGAEASLAVLGGAYDWRGLNINGETTAYTHYADTIVHKMLGHVPVLLAKDPHAALIIGFGLGSTAWSMAQYPLQRIDCVELVPEETETARYFLPENGGVLDDPRFHFIVGDGRNYLLTSRNKYDVISMNAISPRVSPYLYTIEFYRLCKSQLSEGGVMCAWVPSNTGHLATLLKTFQSVFPHTSVWFCNTSHLVLIGTSQPLTIDFSRLQARMSQPAVRDNLAEVWLDDPVHLLSNLILNEHTVKTVCAHAALNTDDLPCVQFISSLDVPPKLIHLDNVLRMVALQDRVLPYITNVGNETMRARLAKRLERHFTSMQQYVPVSALWWEGFVSSQHKFQALEQMESAVASCPEDPRLCYDLGMAWANVLATCHEEVIVNPDLKRRALSALEKALPDIDGTATRPPERFFSAIRLRLAALYLSEGQFSAAKREAELVLQVEHNDQLARLIVQKVLFR